MGSFARLVSTESRTAAQERWDWVKYMSAEGFSPWENEYLHCYAEKNHNNAGNKGRVASPVSSFCITLHSGVWIHDSIDKAQLPHTFSTHSSLYKSFTTLNITPTLATPEHFGCFWIWNDWLGLLRPESIYPGNSLFILLPSGKRFRSMMAKTERLRRSFFPQATRLLNSNSVS